MEELQDFACASGHKHPSEARKGSIENHPQIRFHQFRTEKRQWIRWICPSRVTHHSVTTLAEHVHLDLLRSTAIRPKCPLAVEEFFLAREPSSSAEVRGLVIHDIKEVESVRQQDEQEDKRDEEIGDEMNGEVQEVTRRAHET